MARVQVTVNFYLDELVPKSILDARGERAIQLLDMRIIQAAQFIREQLGETIYVNNWFNGGNLDECGLRTFNTKTGAVWSQHKFGRALDLHSSAGVKRMYEVVKDNEKTLIADQLLTTVEDISFTPTWLHIDCRWTGLDKLLIVQP